MELFFIFPTSILLDFLDIVSVFDDALSSVFCKIKPLF